MAKKSCALNPIRTPLLVKCIDVVLLVITKMVNISLESDHFPSAWKKALVRSILKKHGLDTVFKNYWPVSNLSFISKVTERGVFLQIDNHMKKHDLYPSLQSAYRKNHSTETALLKVTNDILMEMNSQHAVLLVLLDLVIVKNSSPPPTVGRQSANCGPTVGQLWADSFFHSFSDLSADSR